MSLELKLLEDYKQAMKNKESIKKEILNFIISLIKYKKIEIQKEVSDEDIIQIIKKEIKSRQESITYLEKSWNTDEINIENQRIQIMQEYLPTMLTLDQLTDIVNQKILETWIQDPKKERWKLIWAVMQNYKTVIDWKMLNDIINSM